MLIIACSVIIFVYAKYVYIEIDEKYNTSVKCKFVPNKTELNVINEIDNRVNNSIVNYCYCWDLYYNISSISSTKNYILEKSGKTYQPCNEWFMYWLKSKILIYLVIFMVPLLNVLLSWFLESKFFKL